MTVQKICCFAISALILSACSGVEDTSPETTTAEIENESLAVSQDRVEIAVTDKLDGVTSNYCIDVAGGNQNIDITRGLQAHTCYSYRGSLGTDQTFLTSRLSENILYMPDFDVCATLDSLNAGSSVGLAACDGSDMQAFSFSGNGTITSVAAPQMCLTARTETRFGRSDVHQIKELTLETCSAELNDYQQWTARTVGQ